MSNDYMQGVRDCQYFYKSKNYAWIHKPCKGEDAMRLFFPPVKQVHTMVSMPLPKDRQDWIKGFEEEQINILADMEREDE